MCNFNHTSVPKGWQWVCLKSSGAVPHDSQDCSAFCSPNGKRFTSLEKVHEYNRQIEKAKLEKENRRILAGSLRQEKTVNKVTVNNSSMLACNYCEERFFSPSMLKKHEREVHSKYNSSRMINCEHCSESFPTMPHLQKHVREFHMSSSHPCKFCGKQFESMYRLDEHVKTFHRKSSSAGQFEPLNLSQKQVLKSNVQYNPREVEDRMYEIVNKNKNAPRELKQFQDSNVSSLFPTGISISGPSLKNPKPHLNNIKLVGNNVYRSEAESRMSNLKDLTYSKKQKYQPLGPQIMEQKSFSGSNQCQQNSAPYLGQHQTEPRKQISPEAMVARLKAEYKQLQPNSPQQMYNQPQQMYNQPQQMYSQTLPTPGPFRRPAPITGEEMLQALNSKSLISHARRRDVSLPSRRAPTSMPRGEVSRIGLRKVSKKVGYKLKPARKQAYNPSIAGKNQISVSMACKYLGLKDYPVPVNENNRQFFENRSNFEEYYLPLVGSVNKGANALSIQTLVKAKWFEVLKAKIGESRSIYFNKPRRNKVKVNVAVS